MTEPLVAPFRGERYSDVAEIASLIAPPYDVISSSQRGELSRDPRNVVCVTLPEGENAYQSAADILSGWRADGTLVEESEPAVYVLRQSYSVDGKRYARTGVICAIAAEPYSAGRVKPHERTHANIKEDRLALLKSTRTMCESLFFLAPDRDGSLEGALSAVTDGSEPVVTTVLGDVDVELWAVTGANAEKMAALAGKTHIYIADGHHRFETSWAMREADPSATRTLGLIVPSGDSGLIVLPTHRLLPEAEGSPATAGEILAESFEITPVESIEAAQDWLDSIDETACVVAFKSGEVFGCRLKSDFDLSALSDEKGEVVANLDIARIDALVVDSLKGTTGKPGYVASTSGVSEALDNGCNVAVLVKPTGVERVIEVADAGGFMPQKATYFVPKVPSGLVFLKLSEEV